MSGHRDGNGFSASRQGFESVVLFLEADESLGLSHAELEDQLAVSNRELFRLLFQDHLSLRAEREGPLEGVVDSSGVPRPSIGAAHRRPLCTVFGEVEVERFAYRRRGELNLYPADAALNLPTERHSHGLRRWSSIEGSLGSFNAALEGGALDVAVGIRRRATSERLKILNRKGADLCATYLTNKAAYLDYPTALTEGWPIATGIIEGACRHIVKDRMDLTGARWSLEGAEAVLKLRSLRSNGDFDSYWRFHFLRERERIHWSRYADGAIPRAA